MSVLALAYVTKDNVFNYGAGFSFNAATGVADQRGADDAGQLADRDARASRATTRRWRARTCRPTAARSTRRARPRCATVEHVHGVPRPGPHRGHQGRCTRSRRERALAAMTRRLRPDERRAKLALAGAARARRLRLGLSPRSRRPALGAGERPRPRARRSRARQLRPRSALASSGAAGQGTEYTREGRRHLPGLPRPGERHRDLQHRGDLQDARTRSAATRTRRSAPAACSARPATARAPATRRKGSKKTLTINSFKANSFLTSVEAQRALPRLPPGPGAHRLACRRARAQRARLHRLPPAARRARRRAGQGQPARGLLRLPQAAARRLPEDVDAPGALRPDGRAATATTRTARPAWRC